jgi:hypothetical protein
MTANTKKSYPIFHEPGELTDDTPVMGIPGRAWDAALTNGFVDRLQAGNEILRRRKGNAADPGPDIDK